MDVKFCTLSDTDIKIWDQGQVQIQGCHFVAPYLRILIKLSQSYIFADNFSDKVVSLNNYPA